MAYKFQVFSLNETNPEVKDLRKRKAHKKSRLGCLACKARKVKCDQHFPVCLRCRRNSRSCSYDLYQSDASVEEQAAWADAAAKAGSSALLLAQPNDNGPLGLSGMPELGTPVRALWYHHQENWELIYGMPKTDDITTLIHEHPYLRNIMLAIAASHLRHHVSDTKEPKLAEHFQQSLALRDFQKQLAKPIDSFNQKDVDTLLMGAVMINMLTFVLPSAEDAEPVRREPDPSKSWVFSMNEDRLDWLSVQMGFKSLILLTERWHQSTILVLQAFFSGMSKDATPTPVEDGGPCRILQSWRYIFKIDDDDEEILSPSGEPNRSGKFLLSSTEMTAAAEEETEIHFYRRPIQSLLEIKPLEPSATNVFRFLHFVGTLTSEFRHRLYERDEKAIWVFGMWLGCMSRFRHFWWMGRRVTRDFNAILMWFDQRKMTERPGLEGLAWAELLRDLKDSCDYKATRDGEAGKTLSEEPLQGGLN